MKTLVVITGPTGVGKTDIAIQVAERLDTEIISADSRQLYHEIPIGTAAPTSQELNRVKHHFVGTLDLEQYYSAAEFEVDSLAKINELFATHDYVVMCGGSMMYIDAVCNGIDELPTITSNVRALVMQQYEQEGLNAIQARLQELDPEYYAIVDKNNHKRIIHAIEICIQSGTTYTSLRTGTKKTRDFNIVKIALNLPREVLFDHINRRVDKMIESGLMLEASKVYPKRKLNSLNTVGYKELFAYFDGTMELNTAIERIKKNTRVYAKKQLTWYAKDKDIIWCEPNFNDLPWNKIQQNI